MVFASLGALLRHILHTVDGPKLLQRAGGMFTYECTYILVSPPSRPDREHLHTIRPPPRRGPLTPFPRPLIPAPFLVSAMTDYFYLFLNFTYTVYQTECIPL